MENTVKTENLLEVKDLHVIYKAANSTVRAVNGISLSLKPGETLGLVGETGAGKTTTALAILSLLPERTGRITNGSIRYREKELTAMDEKELQLIRGSCISMIFQDPMTSLNPVMTVGDQIYEALMLHNDDNLSKQQLNDRVDELLELVGIEKHRRREYPHQFSGGMKQRVVIAMGIACSPELLIADEPTTALDVTIQAQVLATLEELKQKLNMSMIMITHDLGLVAENCDRVAIMYAGELVEQGTVEDIFEGEHHHPYTTGLFNAIPDLDKAAERLQPIEGLVPDPSNLPAGCKFHPRCPHCTERCRTEHPAGVTMGSQVIQCHLFAKEDSHADA